MNQSVTKWCLGGSIADGTGEIPVIIDNKVIEELIGFTCDEFHSTNQPTSDMIEVGNDINIFNILSIL